jgi:hypothetical protein
VCVCVCFFCCFGGLRVWNAKFWVTIEFDCVGGVMVVYQILGGFLFIIALTHASHLVFLQFVYVELFV